jgi:methenyltetrahydrofolate cyclohydrolase
VAELAAEIARCGNQNVRGDAAAAAILASAAARVAANLVEINLATVEGDNRVERAGGLVRSAENAARRATGEGE